MHLEISITPDWTGEVGIVRLCEAIMTQRRRGVACAVQTLEQRDLGRMLFRRSGNGGEELLDLSTVGQIAHRNSTGQTKFTNYAQRFRLGIFVCAMDGRNRA